MRGRLGAAVSDAEKKTWYADWPPNGSPAPQLGDRFTIALGGADSVTATLTTLGFLSGCGHPWTVGIAAVNDPATAQFTRAEASAPAIFLARRSDKADTKRAVAQRADELGPPILSTAASSILTADTRRRLAIALSARMVEDYTALLQQRQSLHDTAQTTPLAEVEGDPDLLKGTAALTYIAQQVPVGRDAERWYVRAEWRARGKDIYEMRAWFTAKFDLDSVTDSEVPEGRGAKPASLVGPGTILKVFDGSLVPTVEKVGNIDMPQTENFLLMRGDAPQDFALMHWTDGGLLPTGVRLTGCHPSRSRPLR